MKKNGENFKAGCMQSTGSSCLALGSHHCSGCYSGQELWALFWLLLPALLNGGQGGTAEAGLLGRGLCWPCFACSRGGRSKTTCVSGSRTQLLRLHRWATRWGNLRRVAPVACGPCSMQPGDLQPVGHAASNCPKVG